MELIIVKIDAPKETNLILGQTHFIKSVAERKKFLRGIGYKK